MLIVGAVTGWAPYGAEAAAVEPVVWHVAPRTDNQPGRGTPDDPFDAGSPEKFRALIAAAPDGAKLLLGPGVYSVGPGLSFGDGKSLSIVGSNRTKTVLKLRDNLPSGKDRTHPDGGIVLNFWADGGGYYSQDSSLYLSDLTLDANVGGSPNSVNFTADALHTNYPTVVIERVNVVNCGGSENYPTESFHVAVWYPYHTNDRTRTWNWYQRFSDISVVVRDGATRTATVFAVGVCARRPQDAPPVGYTIIENSSFAIAAGQDNSFGVGIASLGGAVFRNNVVVMRGKATFMNADTWDHSGATFEGNKIFLHDRSSGIRLGSGPDEGTFYDDIIRDNQFFVASPEIGFAIQLNGVTRATIEGNQFLSFRGATGRLTPIDINNTYSPHKNEFITIRDNLLDTRLFQFPVAQVRGEPLAGVVAIIERNRSADGRLADGPANGLLVERKVAADVALEHASPESQVLIPQRERISVRLPRITDFPDGPDSVLPGRRFVIFHRGTQSGLRVADANGRQVTRLLPGGSARLAAAPSGWLIEQEK